MDEDTLGIARAGPRGREDRAQVHEEGELHGRRSAASCRRRTRRSSGSARTASRSCSARSTCCATTCARQSGARCAGTIPTRPSPRASRQPRRPPHRRVIERVWRAGGTFQEWSEHFELDRWLDAMAAEGLDPDWYVTRHRTDDEILPWDHIAAGLHRDFLWHDWQAALAEHGLPDCRWTPCYDCGVCTDYALEHVVASAVPPAGGSQGTGQDLALRRAMPVSSRARSGPSVSGADEGRQRVPGARRVHEAGQGALHLAPRRRPRASSARSASSSCRSRSPRASRPARRSASGSRCRSATRATPSTSTSSSPSRSTSSRSPSASLAALPEGIDGHRRGARSSTGARVAGSGHRGRVAGRGRRRPTAGAVGARRARDRCVDARLASDELLVTRTRKGKESVDDIRPAIRRIEVAARRRRARARAHPVDAIPRCPSPARCSPRLDSFVGVGLTEHRAAANIHNGSSATARGWSRWKPTRSRAPSRRARHERRNRCPTRRSRRPAVTPAPSCTPATPHHDAARRTDRRRSPSPTARRRRPRVGTSSAAATRAPAPTDAPSVRRRSNPTARRSGAGGGVARWAQPQAAAAPVAGGAPTRGVAERVRPATTTDDDVECDDDVGAATTTPTPRPTAA